MDRRRAVLLTQYFSPEIGAPQSRLLELGKGLKERGWQVLVITAMPNYPTGRIYEGYRRKWKLSETIEDMEVIRYWLYPSNSARKIPRILSMISFSITSLFSKGRLKRYRPHVIIVESPPLTLGLTGLALSFFCNSRFVLNVSDLWPLSAKRLGALSDGILYRTIERLERFLYRRADACSGQSLEIVNHIGRNKIDNVWLLRNGVDTRRFFSTPAMSKGKRIVYAGLLGVAQGLLEICKEIDFASMGIEFHIYGSGNQQRDIENFLKVHPGKGIVYKGVASRDQVPGILSGYDAALIPLVTDIYGAVPSKIYEALAAGLPLLFSGSGEGSSITQEYGVGWTSPPGDWPALIENIGQYLAMPEPEFQALRNHCKEVATTHFDRQGQVAEFETRIKKFVS